MKPVIRTALVLLVGVSVSGRGYADSFFPRHKASPYAPLPQGTVTRSEHLVPVAAPSPAPAAANPAPPVALSVEADAQAQAVQPAAAGDDQAQVQQVTYANTIPAEGGVRKVNSKTLHFDYDLKDVGPSGIQGVEVWYTQDGKNWSRFDRSIQQAGGTVQVNDDGVYGISFVAKTGFGGGKEPPQAGDAPQMWLEVDTLKPTVALTGLQPSAGSRTLRVDWTAADKNLGKQPIVLYYAVAQEGPWVPFTGSLENTGNYVWQIPPGTPPSFWLRIECTDMAGNVATTESQNPVHIDLATPNVTNIRVSAAAGQ